MANTPNIRFKGFSDDWEQRKVGDISTITAGGTPSTKELSYWEPKEIPWLSSGEVHKKYIYDTDEMISEKGLINSSAKWVEKDSVLIALAGQGKTRGTAAITRVPITTNQSIAAIKFDNILNPDYAFQNLDLRYDELRNISSGDGTRGGLNKQLLSDLEIMFPSLEEQKQIGAYFYNLDHLITLHQRKCDEAKQLKKFMLQKMFPKSGELIPEIRFAGFTDDWEQRKLGEIFEEYSEKNHPELPPLMIIQGGGTILREESDRNLQYNKSSLPGYKMVRKDDFIVHLRSFEGGLEKANSDGVISPAYHTFHGGDTDSRFYYPFFRSRYFIDVLLKPHVYGIRDGKSIDIDGMKTIMIPVPSYEEQKKIGEYIENLDHLITLHQHKYDELKKVKRFMLQNMFPQKG